MANASPIFDPNSQVDAEKTFVMFVQSADIQMMKLELKSNPALVNAKDQHGTPALHLALQAKEMGVFNLLLEKGADPRVKDEHGVTPDRLALLLGLTDAAAELKRRAIKLDLPDKTSALRQEFENVIQGFAKGSGRELSVTKATFKPRKRDSVNRSPVA